MAFNYSPKIVTDGLVLYLDAANTRSYISGSTSWNDISRSGTSGTLVNGPTFNGANGGSIVFDGVDDYVNLSTINIPTSSFTCECVFKYNTTANGNTLFNLNYSFPNSGYLIRQNNGPIIVFSNNGTESGQSSISSITPNIVYHLVVTQNNNVCSIYINGSLNRQAGLNNPVLNPLKDTYLGRRGEPAIGAYLNGNIYLSKVYNRALSATEILQNYNATKTRFGL